MVGRLRFASIVGLRECVYVHVPPDFDPEGWPAAVFLNVRRRIDVLAMAPSPSREPGFA